MPLYEYACPCGRTQEAFRSVANRNRAPRCCGKPMRRLVTASYQITPLFEPYRAVGPERGTVIRTRAEHRAYLRRHGREEVGNDASYAPPAPDPQERAEQLAALEELAHIGDDAMSD